MGRSKQAYVEFKEFYSICYIKNKRLTIAITLFVILAIFDETKGFFKGHGTISDIFEWVISHKDLISKLLI
jgi:hypothetical protein